MKSEPFGPLDPSLYRETVRRALAGYEPRDNSIAFACVDRLLGDVLH